MINTDTKIVAVLVVAIVAVGGVSVYFMMNGGDNSSGHPDYIELALTNDVYEDHTCCVVIAKDSYLSANADASARFLRAYIEGVNYLNAALGGDNDKYNNVLNVAKNQLSSTGITQAEIEAAMDNITYLYADAGNNLSTLKTQIGTLYDDLDALNTFVSTDKATKTQVQDGLVNDATLTGALDITSVDPSTPVANVKVCVIAGDVHQIAIHVANELGYFADYKVNVSIMTAAAGGGVASAVMLTGADGADFGLLGAPPATINTVNRHLIVGDAEGAKYTIISRVNSEGSGIYIDKKCVDADSIASGKLTRNGVRFFSDTYTVSSVNAAAWGGLVFATPGMQSIQHIQLNKLASDMGMEFVAYNENTSLDSGKLYFIAGLSDSVKVFNNTHINGGIIWEPQYQRIITE